MKQLQKRWKKEEQAAAGVGNTDLLNASGTQTEFATDLEARQAGAKFKAANPGATVRYKTVWTCPACGEQYPQELLLAKAHRLTCEGAPMWGVMSFVVFVITEYNRR